MHDWESQLDYRRVGDWDDDVHVVSLWAVNLWAVNLWAVWTPPLRS